MTTKQTQGRALIERTRATVQRNEATIRSAGIDPQSVFSPAEVLDQAMELLENAILDRSWEPAAVSYVALENLKGRLNPAPEKAAPRPVERPDHSDHPPTAA